ncbi:putative fluoride ion transporter CrcB (plasmid) [Ruegeria pomeroyi DSS-3]|uniref:Fluoride-specific ion channel FluC n=2 Tax=Ruegeria pomeroyi TaxID=89184 RepID=FLUC_RUEPO|nr:CrcB family protein [Ruegeria pomeroyi]Q5LLI6.1 RecName: Full=Fluoride-specific ion channel FluC [Ruegeria pomeroyi DSS-3]HCE70412.1 CrcB family protein [Ruegeria sp.]AAV97181.1 putative fluoride ion transporter CrcB [Ruegeria pomeroyi DSS-3]NVK95577.1 CrcB family protein [Ruegeria pomeroyi]NVL02721.1 CrcB family protein [Ruegeria pomeroyi]
MRQKAGSYLAVFAGGAIGSVLRELLGFQLPGLSFLTATFGINIAACFLLGWLYAIRHRLHPHLLHLGAVGFCGGLSTFSSFVLELDQLTRMDGWSIGLTAMTLEIAAGLAAAILGEALGRGREARR